MMRVNSINGKKLFATLIALAVALGFCAFISARRGAAKASVAALSYTGSSLNYAAGEAQAAIETDILAGVTITDLDFSMSDVTIAFSEGAFTGGLLNGGVHTATLEADITSKQAEPVEVKVYAITDYVNFLTDRDGSTSKAYSTGIIPTEQPNTIESWVYIPSGTNATWLGYVTGNGAGGSGVDTVNLVFYGNGQFSLFWKGANRPAVNSSLAVPLNTWTHVATIRDAAAQVIYYYINGELVYTTPVTAIIGQDANAQNAAGVGGATYQTYGIGKDGRNQDDRKMPGWISTVGVFSSVRTQSEIQADMAAALIGGGFSQPETQWLWVDFNDQSMAFNYPAGSVQAITGVSAATAAAQIKASVSVTDCVGRVVAASAINVVIESALISGGDLVEGAGTVTVSATDLFGNVQQWPLSITVSPPVPIIDYDGGILSYAAGKTQAAIESYILGNTDTFNTTDPVSIQFSSGALTAGVLNAGAFTVTLSISGADPIVVNLYGLKNYVAFEEDRTGVTNNAYSTGIIPTEQPNTIEAWVYIPTGLVVNDLGYVTGNGAGGSGADTVNFSFYGNGAFTLFWKGSNRPAIDTIPALKVPLDTWTHVASVRDKAAQVIRYYINGELVYTTAPAAIIGEDANANSAPSGYREYGIGKDGRLDLNRRMPGWISTVAIYSIQRTQAEIKADMAAAITGAGMTTANNLIYYANVYDVINDATPPTITFNAPKTFTAVVGSYNTAFEQFVTNNLVIVDNNLFGRIKYTIDYNGALTPFDEFNEKGTYTITITAEDLAGNRSSIYITVTVQDEDEGGNSGGDNGNGGGDNGNGGGGDNGDSSGGEKKGCNKNTSAASGLFLILLGGFTVIKIKRFV